MRTTVDLDDDLVRALSDQHPNLSRTQAIEAAIRAYLQESASERRRSLAGTMDIDDVSADLRRHDRKT
jgi:metal-responsive CopG/Arc/MetJ family transcriptional regulator